MHRQQTVGPLAALRGDHDLLDRDYPDIVQQIFDNFSLCR